MVRLGSPSRCGNAERENLEHRSVYCRFCGYLVWDVHCAGAIDYAGIDQRVIELTEAHVKMTHPLEWICLNE